MARLKKSDLDAKISCIAGMVESGMSITKIAGIIGDAPSNVSRFCKKNGIVKVDLRKNCRQWLSTEESLINQRAMRLGLA